MHARILHGLFATALLLMGCNQKHDVTNLTPEEGLRFREPGREWTAFFRNRGVQTFDRPNDGDGLKDDSEVLYPIEAFFFQPEAICPPDDRGPVANPDLDPWSGNCRLIITTATGRTGYGTGWLMGPRLVITAGHCVHEGDDGDFYTRVEVIRGTDGAATPFGSRISTNFRAAELWKSAGKKSNDYGAIFLDQPFDGAPFMRKPVVKTDAELGVGNIEVAGYPLDKMPQQWFDTDPISQIRPEIIRYDLDTTPGQSGSAVMHGGVVVGIHNYGGCPNSATRITPAVLTQLNAWLEESNH